MVVVRTRVQDKIRINNINIKMDFTPITIIMIRWTQLPVVSSSSHSLTNSNSSQGLEV